MLVRPQSGREASTRCQRSIPDRRADGLGVPTDSPPDRLPHGYVVTITQRHVISVESASPVERDRLRIDERLDQIAPVVAGEPLGQLQHHGAKSLPLYVLPDGHSTKDRNGWVNVNSDHSNRFSTMK